MRNDSQLKIARDDFAAAFASGHRPSIESYLERYADVDRAHLLATLVHIELTYICSDLPQPSESNYLVRFPDDRSAIAEGFRKFHAGLPLEANACGPESSTIPPTCDRALAETIIETGNDASGDSRVSRRVRYFGDYELLHEVARGGMGVVYRARQISLNRIVAFKMILAGHLADKEDIQRFQQEAKAAANLDHPGIVPIHEIGEHEGQHYFSMAFVEGQSLADRLRDGPLGAKEAAQIVRRAADAVSFAHENGVIHRDLKPANILLDHTGTPKITDFGLAKQVDSGADLTQSGAVMGTPSYMSPEQASGKTRETGELSDVYSLGAILYAVLTGRPPFQAGSLIETLNQVVEKEPVRPRKIDRSIDPDIETITLKCLSKDPQQRYSSAAELSLDLQRFLVGWPVYARPQHVLPRLMFFVRRQPAATASLMLSACLISLCAQIVAARPDFWPLLDELLGTAALFLAIEGGAGLFGGLYIIVALRQQENALLWMLVTPALAVILGGALFLSIRFGFAML